MINSRPAMPTLLPTCFIEPTAPDNTPIFIYGAGHVGRALVKMLEDLPFDIHWVDTHDHRFPAPQHHNVQRIIARDPSIIARAAPPDAFHVVLTYSHTLDLAICRALLVSSKFAFLGLIGSKTKNARFVKRLRESGIKARPYKYIDRGLPCVTPSRECST